MTKPQKLPTELEKKIQTLASDISVQVEDTLSSFLVKYTATLSLTNEQIEQHPYYQQSQKNAKIQQETQQKQTEVITKAQERKLAEATAIQKEQQRENDGLSRGDKAKAATVEAQNNQITELQLQVMKVTAELERFQAEQHQAIETATQNENQTKELENDLAKELIKLTEELKVNVGQTALLQQALENANKEKSDLSKQLQNNEKISAQINSELQQQKEQWVLSNQTFEEKIKALNKEHKIQKMGNQQKLALLSQENNAILASLNKDHQLEVDKLAKAIEEKNNKNQQDQLALKNMQTTMMTTQADRQKISAAERQKYDDLVERLTATEWQHKQDKAEHKAIKDQVQSLKIAALNKQSIAGKNKEKQEAEYTKARDTIKHLRDDNIELKTKLAQQVSELENKLTEYRLRFEYAQKQLAKNN